ncbi:MAG: hypothetical protein RMJ14_04485 [Nitrososphaerota archaeon]|nr:hypothetical protein [Aigarchaeota archaeon]MDW8076875.1 hypothetical protein [Nitrososphaerota archaeon]
MREMGLTEKLLVEDYINQKLIEKWELVSHEKLERESLKESPLTPSSRPST